MGQFCPVIVEQREVIGRTFGIDRSGVALRGSHTRGRGCIDPVVLAPATAGELPDPGGGGGRNVEHEFAEVQ